jgi:hypothetical protein
MAMSSEIAAVIATIGLNRPFPTIALGLSCFFNKN